MEMKCHDIDLLLIDYLDGNLQNGEKKAVEKHLESCERCHIELMQYRELFNAIGDHQTERPSPVLRENFNTMLQSELNILATTNILKQESEPKKAKVFQLSGMLVKAAAVVVLVAGGVFMGTLIKKDNPAQMPNAEMAGLKNEVAEMKAALMFNLLKDESASERLKAVAYTEQMSNPDPQVLSALINTMNADANVNVRLAALNSISRYTSSQLVRDSLVNSLKTQKEPLVQIVLISILTDKKELKAKAPLQDIISSKETIQPVKDAAKKGLSAL